jgi:hypothetical protein
MSLLRSHALPIRPPAQQTQEQLMTLLTELTGTVAAAAAAHQADMQLRRRCLSSKVSHVRVGKPYAVVLCPL